MRARRHFSERVKASPRVTGYDWTQALATGLMLCAVTQRDGEDPAFGEQLVRWRAWLKDLTSESFPAPSPIARLLAGAWLNAARAYAHDAGHLPSRTACAPLLIQATETLEQLLAAHRTEQADATWKRQYRDDD